MMKCRRKLSWNLNLKETTAESLTSVLWHKRASAYVISLIWLVCNLLCSFSHLQLSPLSNALRLLWRHMPSADYAVIPASLLSLYFYISIIYIYLQQIHSCTKSLTNGLTHILNFALCRGSMFSAAFCFLPAGPFGQGHCQQALGSPCAGARALNSPAVAERRRTAACSLQYFPGVSGLVFRKNWKCTWENSGFLPLPFAKAEEPLRAAGGCSTAGLLGGPPADRLRPGRPPGLGPRSSAVPASYGTGDRLARLLRNCRSPCEWL